MVLTWFCYIIFLSAFAYSSYGKMWFSPTLRTEFWLTTISLFFVLISLHQVLSAGEVIIKERYGHDLFLTLPSTPTELEITKDRLERTFNPNYWLHRSLGIGADAQSSIARGHVPDIAERMKSAYAKVSKDKASLDAAYVKGVSSFDASIREKKRYGSILAMPAAGKPGLWNRVKEFLLYAVSSNHRQLRKLDRKGQELSIEASELAEAREVFAKYYDLNGVSSAYQKEKSALEVSMAQQNFSSAYRNLVEMVTINSKFKAKMASASENASKAPWMFFLFKWGMLLFLVSSVILQLGLRILNPQASPYIVPGLILFSGIGWGLLFDISLNFNPDLRYLAFYHGRALLAGYLIMFAVVAILPAFFNKVIHPSLEAPGDERIIVTLAVVSLAFVLSSKIIPSNILSELLKLWTIVLLSWFFAFRGEFITETISKTGFSHFTNHIRVLIVYVPLVLLSLCVSKDIGAFVLICTILAAAYIILLGGLRWIPGLCCASLTVSGLLYLGAKCFSCLQHIPNRFKEAWAPFRMGTGHLARLAWFREDAGAWGYGFGKVRWYGYHGNTGVPKQIQSDYSYSALVGAIGSWGAILCILLFAVWLGIIFIDSQSSDKRNLSAQFFSFFGIFSVLLLLLQSLVTIAGNLTMAPLTGITMPFISHGFYSYVCSCVLIAVLYCRARVMSQFNDKGY